ncbi:uncharacterized protein LOC132196285 [Neocloeon triangulifer]|uniref:uncharacterized protein LOC132196285 n=1 Tax=Neocloeon triangulifer TaxID=2078957 RepID=UPI00286F876D|nr:uncharacterized protein LOC132196285 [Neocloeon triangulifer]
MPPKKKQAGLGRAKKAVSSKAGSSVKKQKKKVAVAQPAPTRPAPSSSDDERERARNAEQKRNEEKERNALLDNIREEEQMIQSLKEMIESKRFEMLQASETPAAPYTLRDAQNSVRRPIYAHIKSLKSDGNKYEEMLKETEFSSMVLGAKIIKAKSSYEEKERRTNYDLTMRLLHEENAPDFTISFSERDKISKLNCQLLNEDKSQALKDCFALCSKRKNLALVVQLMKTYQNVCNNRFDVCFTLQKKFGNEFVGVKLKKESNKIVFKVAATSKIVPILITWEFEFIEVTFTNAIVVEILSPELSELDFIKNECGPLIKVLTKSKVTTEDMVASFTELLKCLKKNEKRLKRRVSSDI